MENCINGAKSLIKRQVHENKISIFGAPFVGYQKVFFWTNENIKDCLNLVSFDGKKNALSVTASGDHAFNLITKGILDVDTFDVNRLTECYVLGLKRALVIKHDYHSFITTIQLLTNKKTSIDIISNIIYDVLPLMDERYRFFWKTILDYNFKIQKENLTNLNLMHMLFIGIDGTTDYIENNNYLSNENSYNLFKSNLIRANINFKEANAIDLDNEFDNKYDLILLSNILDYFGNVWDWGWNYEKLLEYEKRLETLAKKDAVIFLKYIMKYSSSNGSWNSSFAFSGSSAKISEFKDEKVYKILKNDGTYSYDGIILKRVK